jgi:serine protease
LTRRFDPEGSSEKVADLLNIWLVRSQLPEKEVLEWLRRQPEVRFAQFNHLLENRAQASNLLPDDPFFTQQWHLVNDGSVGVFDADLDAEQAWDISTGGLTPAGDTIVLAVIDGGLDATHPDLTPNQWRNWAEIPNNGLDDDLNGYVDDFRGWNVFSQNDMIEGNSTNHGTPVCGILGASGNNGLGVSGVNWSTKIMFVAASGTEAAILSAYDYVLKARQRYNTTVGGKGAFVVAVNCSWGIDYGQPSEAPLWCEAFDVMGGEGIVSVAATANLPINVDEVGDLPTACPSNFLISVTSLNRYDEKVDNAAWGSVHIDLGAYGKEVLSTASLGGYGQFSGTSYAAPQVSGALGLLYAAPCPNLIALAKTDPASAAYWAKSLVLETITPNPSLTGKTYTEGRLNLFRTLQNYQSQCSSCPAPFALKTETETDTSSLLLWSKPMVAESVNLRWRKLGVGAWNFIPTVTDSFMLSGLSVCTAYEFEMQSDCGQGVVSAWSQPNVFETKGCCVAPSSVWADSVQEDYALIAWEPTSSINLYRIRFRKLGDSNWGFVIASNHSWVLQNLSPCTTYEMQVQARCEEWYTVFSPLISFKTKGCGACTEVGYCAVMGSNATEEWITSVHIGNWSNESGAGGNGYQNFTGNQLASIQLVSQTNIPIKIIPGYSGSETKEYFRVFVDYNQDGDFEDDDELVFDPGFALEGAAEGIIYVPELALGGSTRLRVMMKFTTPNDNPPTPCANFDFGQTEDYCAELLVDSVLTSIPVEDTVWVLRAYPQPAQDWVLLEYPEPVSKGECEILVADMTGRVMLHQQAPLLRNGKVYLDTKYWPSGIYGVQARCGGKVMRGKLLKG